MIYAQLEIAHALGTEAGRLQEERTYPRSADPRRNKG